MQGELKQATELQEDEVLETIMHILTPESQPPLRGYYNAGLLGPELKLIESIVMNRCGTRKMSLSEDQNDDQAYRFEMFTFLVAPIIIIYLIQTL